MPFEPLYSRLPELAEAETRSALVQAKESSDLPAACYRLNLFTEALLRDSDYIERIKCHYKLFRATVGRG